MFFKGGSAKAKTYYYKGRPSYRTQEEDTNYDKGAIKLLTSTAFLTSKLEK